MNLRFASGNLTPPLQYLYDEKKGEDYVVSMNYGTRHKTAQLNGMS